MSKKRFHAKIDECGVYCYVCENGNILAETYYIDDAEDIAKRLNELYDENQQLKKENATMKGRILNSIRKSQEVLCNCRECQCEKYVSNECMKW